MFRTVLSQPLQAMILLWVSFNFVGCGTVEHVMDLGAPPPGPIDSHLVFPPVVKIPQGTISGTVLWREGNWMPGPGSGFGEEHPMSTQVAAFPPTTINEVTVALDKPEAYGRYHFGTVEPIQQTQSNGEGHFEMELAVGFYTVVAEDEGAWYSNQYSFQDGHEYLTLVEVKEGTVTQVEIIMDYAASF